MKSIKHLMKQSKKKSLIKINIINVNTKMIQNNAYNVICLYIILYYIIYLCFFIYVFVFFYLWLIIIFSYNENELFFYTYEILN